MAYKQNVAAGLTYSLINASTGLPETGASPVVKISQDGGAQATSSNASSELGLGQYHLAVTQAEFNAVDIGFLVTETSSITHNIHVHTEPKIVNDLNDLATTDTIDNVTTVASVTDLGSAAVASIWDALTTGITTAGSIGKFILDKLGLITANTAITTTLIIDGGTLTIIQGHTFSFTQDAPVASAGDLAGYTGHLGFTKQTANTGTAALELTATVTDANTSTQKFVYTMTSAQSAALALDTARVGLQVQPTPAYTFTSSATDGATNCPIFSQGFASVVASDTTC